MNKLYLCLGGNKGDVISTFQETYLKIEQEIGFISKKSSVYSTQSWGDDTQPDYLNQVILVKTNLLPQNVLKKCQLIENEFGRVRDINNQWAARTIDIDILLYNSEQIVEKNLIIPHPRMLERNFVMIPLAEIAGSYIHPVKKERIDALATQTNDNLKVKCITTT